MEEPTCPDFTPTLRALLPPGTRVIPVPTPADLPSPLLKHLCRALLESGGNPVMRSMDAPLLP
ncbi:hypothetical protein IHN32_04075 [Deinococcus sp. 14RED07]|uniref:hypothetical protein n=1 Tax=unclassified Deinococcus TaxID=2623546 RepID=UPI001E5CB410|nr:MULTISPECIES: hypothetical protein [unclassified Deinococcus]MCD0160696.1 hypothetical protein [Deinococcus sp. 6YEL10]MCD0165110.1 hypothetical protein [Deinococcus sp. 12RED42]MCD0175128.1 hypothetical protein [Deinococcus sp. 14RED07]